MLVYFSFVCVVKRKDYFDIRTYLYIFAAKEFFILKFLREKTISIIK